MHAHEVDQTLTPIPTLPLLFTNSEGATLLLLRLRRTCLVT